MDNFELIRLVKERTPLWDKNCWENGDAVARENLWEEIAEVLGFSRKMVKSRWKNLRDSYRKIIKNNNMHDTKWTYFKSMQFMKNANQKPLPKAANGARKRARRTIKSELHHSRTHAKIKKEPLNHFDAMNIIGDVKIKQEPSDSYNNYYESIQNMAIPLLENIKKEKSNISETAYRSFSEQAKIDYFSMLNNQDVLQNLHSLKSTNNMEFMRNLELLYMQLYANSEVIKNLEMYTKYYSGENTTTKSNHYSDSTVESNKPVQSNIDDSTTHKSENIPSKKDVQNVDNDNQCLNLTKQASKKTTNNTKTANNSSNHNPFMQNCTHYRCLANVDFLKEPLDSLTSLKKDDDYQFLMSLYYHFKQVPHEKKLPLRMEVERIIHEAIFNK